MDQFNFHRRYHYSTTLKNWGEAGQILESYRINKTQELITILVERIRVMIDRLATVCTDLEAAAASMDAEKVSYLRYTSALELAPYICLNNGKPSV